MNILSQELAFQSRIHQCGIRHSAFQGLTTPEQRKESFRKVIREHQLEEKLGVEFQKLYGEPV